MKAIFKIPFGDAVRGLEVETGLLEFRKNKTSTKPHCVYPFANNTSIESRSNIDKSAFFEELETFMETED